MIRSFALAISAALLMVSSAHAATLSASGSVMVNTGSGFKAVSGTVEVRPGDRILVGASGEARVAYTSTCVTRVAPHAILSILSSPPCDGMMNSGARSRRPTDVETRPVVGDGSLLIPFGAIAAGGIAGAIINARSSNPASP